LAGKAETMQEALNYAAGIEAWFQVWPWCRPRLPYPWTKGKKLTADRTDKLPEPGQPARVLTADGRIIIRPLTHDAVEWTLLAAMPKSHFDTNTNEWHVSTHEEDEEQVLTLAWRLGLTIMPGFPSCNGRSQGQ
jgi:hypothetical protein